MGPSDTQLRYREPTLTEDRALRQSAAQEYTRRLVEELYPVGVILFGSNARSTDRIGSDLDIVIVGGDLPAPISERLRKVARLKWGIPFSIDAFPYTEAEFERMLDNLHVTALDCMYEGIPLHGKEYFERLRPKFEAYVARGLRRGKSAWYFEKQKAE